MEGWVFARGDEAGPMASAAPGRRVAGEGRGPPWIVVCDDVGEVSVNGWPGRLWRVAVADAANDTDMAPFGGRPRPDAGYTRAVAVDVLAEVPAHVLFGPHGRDVCRVVARAEALTAGEAARLAAHRDPGADAAGSRVLNRWLAGVDPASPHLGADLAGVLSLPARGAGLRDSPVGRGLLLVNDLVTRRAAALAGEAAFRDDGEDRWLLPPWSGADDALRDAALALGAPALVPADDARALLAAWAAVFGP